jgi:hypothetical protein
VNSDEVPFADLELREVAEQMNARPWRCREKNDVCDEDMYEKINN